MVVKSLVFWDITPHSPLKVDQRFGGTRRLHQSSVCYLFHDGVLVGLFFDREDGGDVLLRNVG
jgi:hypothetical protein